MERSTEGLHALIHGAKGRGPGAKLPYLSVELRFHQLLMHAVTDPEQFGRLPGSSAEAWLWFGSSWRPPPVNASEAVNVRLSLSGLRRLRCGSGRLRFRAGPGRLWSSPVGSRLVPDGSGRLWCKSKFRAGSGRFRGVVVAVPDGLRLSELGPKNG